MASITIRNLDEKTKARLRVRAAQHFIATRNLADFDGCGVTLVDPWQP